MDEYDPFDEEKEEYQLVDEQEEQEQVDEFDVQEEYEDIFVDDPSYRERGTKSRIYHYHQNPQLLNIEKALVEEFGTPNVKDYLGVIELIPMRNRLNARLLAIAVRLIVASAEEGPITTENFVARADKVVPTFIHSVQQEVIKEKEIKGRGRRKKEKGVADRERTELLTYIDLLRYVKIYQQAEMIRASKH